MTTRTRLTALILGGATLLLGLTACDTTMPSNNSATQTAEETEATTPDSPQVVQPQALELQESIVETSAGVKVTCLYYRTKAASSHDTYTLTCDWVGADRPAAVAE